MQTASIITHRQASGIFHGANRPHNGEVWGNPRFANPAAFRQAGATFLPTEEFLRFHRALAVQAERKNSRRLTDAAKQEAWSRGTRNASRLISLRLHRPSSRRIIAGPVGFLP